MCAALETPLKSHTALWRWSFISLVMEHLSWSFPTSGSSALPKAGLHPCPAQVKPGTGSTTKGPLGHATASVATPHLEKLINNIKVSIPPVLQRKHQSRQQRCPRRLEPGRRLEPQLGEGNQPTCSCCCEQPTSTGNIKMGCLFANRDFHISISIFI